MNTTTPYFNSTNASRFSSKKLLELYTIVTSNLEKAEESKTYQEDQVYLQLRRVTKMKVLRSFWIGNRNVDFFIPGVKVKDGFKGLVIEVDGSFHNRYEKMRKDESLINKLAKLNIATISVRNPHHSRKTFIEDLKGVSQLPRLDFRGRERFLKSLYLYTIFINSNAFQRKNYLSILNQEKGC